MSHVGWGLDERAHWHGLAQFGGSMGMELRSSYGNVMFSIGPDNELIVDADELTVPEMRPAGRR